MAAVVVTGAACDLPPGVNYSCAIILLVHHRPAQRPRSVETYSLLTTEHMVHAILPS